MNARNSLLSTFGRLLFALPFGALGVYALVGTVRGTGPNGSVVGIVFLGVSAFMIRGAFRARQSLESQAKVAPAGAGFGAPSAPAAGYRSLARVGTSAREAYGAALGVTPLPSVITTPGRELSYALSAGEANGQIVVLIFGIVWSLATIPVLVSTIAAGAFMPAAVTLMFVLVGVGLVVAGGGKLMSRMKLPRVEVDEEPVFLGDELRLRVDQPGPARVTRLRVELACRESASYSVGTTTRTEDHEVVCKELLDEPGRELRSGEVWSNELSVTLPANGPPTFKAAHNAVAWTVRVRAQIDGWPDVDERFELRALPRIPA